MLKNLPRARLAKAQADARALASAVSIYSAHMDGLHAVLANLTVVATSAQGMPAGPFLAVVQTPPSGWGAYTYVSTMSGIFNVSNSGDGTSVWRWLGAGGRPWTRT